jgi:hypothetical protein
MFMGPKQTIYSSGIAGKASAINGMTYIGTVKDTMNAMGVILKFYAVSPSASTFTGILSVTTTPSWTEATATTGILPWGSTATGGTNPIWGVSANKATVFLISPIATGASGLTSEFGFLAPFIHVSASSTVSAITASAGATGASGVTGPVCEAFVLYDSPQTLDCSNRVGIY